MNEKSYKIVQYAMAVVLIVTSILLAFIQVFEINDIKQGTLLYIAQAFLLAGSIFGLDYYVKKITYEYKNTKGDSQQQSSEYQTR